MRALFAFSFFIVACGARAAPTTDAGSTVGIVDAAAATVAPVVDASPPPVVSAAPAEAAPTHSASSHPTTSKPAPKAAAYTCKPGEVDNGDGCFKPCNVDKDCAKPMKCSPMMVANPNGGTSTAMTCQKP